MEQATPTNIEPPYQIGEAYPDRSPESDKKALERALSALKFLETQRENKHDLEAAIPSPSTTSKLLPRIRLQLRYHDKVPCQLTEAMKESGAEEHQWNAIGFPNDKSTFIEEFQPTLEIIAADLDELAKDIENIRHKTSASVASNIDTSEELGRKIEKFTLHGRNFVKITFQEADVHNPSYSKLATCKAFEKKVNKGVGGQPSKEVERYLTAEILLRLGDTVSPEYFFILHYSPIRV